MEKAPTSGSGCATHAQGAQENLGAGFCRGFLWVLAQMLAPFRPHSSEAVLCCVVVANHKVSYNTYNNIVCAYLRGRGHGTLGNSWWCLCLTTLICLQHTHHFCPHIGSAARHTRRWRGHCCVRRNHHWMWNCRRSGIQPWLVFLHGPKIFALHHTEFPVINVELSIVSCH